LLCFIDIIVTYFYMKLKAPYHCVHATNYKSIFFLNSGLKTTQPAPDVRITLLERLITVLTS